MVIRPTYMPAPETPQMARPMMKASTLGAALQTVELTSKTSTERRYVHFALNWPYTLPQTRLVLAALMRKATLTMRASARH